MRKALTITAAAAIGLLALTAWAICAVGAAMEGFEDPCYWRDEGGSE